MMALHEQSTGIPLKQLLAGFVDADIDERLSVNGISSDSRMTELGHLFMACKGIHSNGSDYIVEAIEAGASVIAIEEGLDCPDGIDIPVYTVSELAQNIGVIASRFYQHPSRELSLIGITGTNGKTSISWWLAKLYTQLTDQSCGLVGTLGAGRFPDLDTAIHTTPDAITLHKHMAEFTAANINVAFMEASSHALEQGRTAGLQFNIGVFTNLSHEHLDYHGDLSSYRNSKARLFQHDGIECAVLNIDDETGRIFATELASKLELITYAINSRDENIKVVHKHIQARTENIDEDACKVFISGSFGQTEFVTRIKGSFNVSNLLAVIAVLLRLGFLLEDIITVITELEAVPGRLEQFDASNGAKVYVDYAHTPDALEHALATLKAICNGKLICVFGCGGNRDSSKRAKMGAVVSQLTNKIIVTDDNPRNESPEQIVMDIIAGIPDSADVIIEHDRSKAITQAINMAASDDVVLVAGKGHETYQEIKGKRYPFSDRQQVRNCIEGLK